MQTETQTSSSIKTNGPTPTAPSPGAKDKRADLRGLSFAEQEARLAPAPGQSAKSTKAAATSDDPKKKKSKDAKKEASPSEKADQIRKQNPGGFFVALSLPPGYQTNAEARADILAGHIDKSARSATRDRWRAAEKKKAEAEGREEVKKTDAQLNALLVTDSTWLERFAASQRVNNAVFDQESQAIAENQGGIAGDTGAVHVGKHMRYAKKEEISQKVLATAAAVKALLAAHDPQPGDDAVAKVRALGLASHAGSGGTSGHGAGAGAGYKTADVPGIVSAMAPVLSPDIKVALFACHAASTAKDGMTSEDGASEGTLADAYREELNKAGLTQGAVMGHRLSGPAFMNHTTRFMGTGATAGHADWNWKDVYDDAFLASEATRLGLATDDERLKLRRTAVMFYHRYAWLQDSSTLAAFRAGSITAFQERYPDGDALRATTEDYTDQDIAKNVKAHAKPEETNTTGDGWGTQKPKPPKKKKGDTDKKPAKTKAPAKEPVAEAAAKSRAQPAEPAIAKVTPPPKKPEPALPPKVTLPSVTKEKQEAKEKKGKTRGPIVVTGETDPAAVAQARGRYSVAESVAHHRWYVNPKLLFMLSYQQRKAHFASVATGAKALSKLWAARGSEAGKAAFEAKKAALEVSATAARDNAAASVSEDDKAAFSALPILLETEQASLVMRYDDGEKSEKVSLDNASATAQTKHTNGVSEGGSKSFGADVVSQGIGRSLAQKPKSSADAKRATELGTGYMAFLDKHEGRSDSMNTWDVKDITIGPGMASGGALEQAFYELSVHAPAVFAAEVAAFGIGVICQSPGHCVLTVLDPKSGKTHQGMDAIGYIASQPALLAQLRRVGATPEMQVVMVQWVQDNSVAHALTWTFAIEAPLSAQAMADKKGKITLAWVDVTAGLPEPEVLLSLGVIADRKHAQGNTNNIKSAVAAAWLALAKSCGLDPVQAEAWPAAVRAQLLVVVLGKEPADRLATLKQKFLGIEPAPAKGKKQDAKEAKRKEAAPKAATPPKKEAPKPVVEPAEPAPTTTSGGKEPGADQPEEPVAKIEPKVFKAEHKDPAQPARGKGAASKAEILDPENLKAAATPELTDFKKRVFKRQAELALARKEFFPGLPAEMLSEVEGGKRMRLDAASACQGLLAAARSALAADQSAGDALALSTTSLGCASGYRDPIADRSAWEGTFNKHYGKTAAAREKCAGGAHGDQAVEVLVKQLRRFKAVPGFSNHTSGIAMDFKTVVKHGKGDKTLSANSDQEAAWRASWLWRWLGQSAGSHGFKPIASEAWHWEYRP